MALGACGDVAGGNVELQLQLPPTGDLRPVGMTTVGINEIQADGTSSVTTTQLVQDGTGMHFSAGDIAVDVPVTLGAELRDMSARLVGFGAVANPITPSASDSVSVTIPVRKPIVYVAGNQPVTTIDPTRDPIDPKYQASLNTTGAIVVPIDGTEIAVVTSGAVERYATATHMAIGGAISISFGMPLDAAPVPGQRRLVVGTTSGLAVVDIDGNKTTTFPAMRADRVAVGVAGGVATAYLLTGRVSPAIGMTGTCSGSSTVYSIAIDSSGAPAQLATGQFADIAADGVAVFGADPCGGQVKRLESGGKSMPLVGAAALAVQNHQLWAAGSMLSATVGARITLVTVSIDGTNPRPTALPPKSEIVTYDGDSQHELSIFLHADTYIPIDLAVLPDADHVAVIARMDAHRDAAYDTFTGTKVIPEMQATVWDVLLADPVTGATTRIRALCNFMTIANSNAEFPDWSCASPSEGEAPAGGEYTPTAIDSVYGGR